MHYELVCVFFSMYGIIDCLPDDEEVKGKTPVLDVPDVLLDSPLHLPEFLSLSTESGYLGIARNTWLRKMAYHITGYELAVLLCVF